MPRKAKEDTATKAKITTIDVPLAAGSKPEKQPDELALIDAHPQVAPVLEKAPEALQAAKDLIVSDEKTASEANELIVYAKNSTKAVEATRKFFVGPLNDHIRAINAKFKRVTSVLDEINKTATLKLKPYQEEKAQLAREEARTRQEAQQAQYLASLKEAKENNIEVGIERPKIEDDSSHHTVTFSSHGMTSLRHLGWEYEVLDFDKVPPEFKKLVLDDEIIHAAIDGGARDEEIPGLKIVERTTLVTH